MAAILEPSRDLECFTGTGGGSNATDGRLKYVVELEKCSLGALTKRNHRSELAG